MAVAVSYGVKEVVAQTITVAQFVTYITYAVFMVATVGQVGLLFGRMKQGAAMYLKHQHRFEHQNQLKYAANANVTISAQQVGINIENVSFGYNQQQPPILSEISIAIKAGETTALIGQSGVGKSTMAGLLCGLFTAAQGRLFLVDNLGHKVLNYPPPPNTIAIVPQEPFLFSGTFAENIAFGRSDIPAHKIKTAAKQACIDDFIRQQTDGYQTLLDEAGNNLSRGQKQRIAIARALAGDPSILILDEATASLDRASEQAISQTLNDIQGKVTVVIIAHQGQLLDNVQNIILLEQGHVAYCGKAAAFKHNNKKNEFKRDQHVTETT
jgi:ATP-binding cassette subfamily B protein/subfamily B ATP-binding cassette protein MsbA